MIVKYGGHKYPGIITAIKDGDEVQVRCMHHVGCKQFRWPSREDEISYRLKDVIKKIYPPTQVGNRGLYEFNTDQIKEIFL